MGCAPSVVRQTKKRKEMISITTQEINSNSCTPYTSSMQFQTKLFLLSPLVPSTSQHP